MICKYCQSQMDGARNKNGRSTFTCPKCGSAFKEAFAPVNDQWYTPLFRVPEKRVNK